MRFLAFNSKVLSVDVWFIIGLTLVSFVLGLIALFVSYELHARPIWELFSFVIVAIMSYKYLGIAGILLRQRWNSTTQ